MKYEKTKLLQEESDPAIEESGNEGIFENEVVESILDSDYSSQLDKLTREVEKSIEDREIQQEFLQDQKQFVKDLFGDEAEQISEDQKIDYDLLQEVEDREDSITRNDIDDNNDDQGQETDSNSNLEGDVVELLNSLSKNDENQEDALKAILQEITQTGNEGETGQQEEENNNDLKDMLLEYRDEPEIEVSATEIVSEIMPDFFDETSEDRKQERQEALLLEIQAEEEAKNEFKNTISELITSDLQEEDLLEEQGQKEEKEQELSDIDDKLTQEENEISSFESIEDEADIDSSIEEADKFADILERDQIDSIDLEDESAKQVDIIIPDFEAENNNSTLLIETPGPIKLNSNNVTEEIIRESPLNFDETLPESHSFAENVVETVLSMFSR